MSFGFSQAPPGALRGAPAAAASIPLGTGCEPGRRPAAPPPLTAAERRLLAALAEPAELRRLALTQGNDEPGVPRQIALLKAKLFPGEAPPRDNEALVSVAIDLGLIDPAAPGAARALAFCQAQPELPLLTPALYDLLLALDVLPPVRAARRLQLSLQGLEMRLGVDLPMALCTTVLPAWSLEQRARRLLQAGARHGLVRAARAHGGRWWCAPDPCPGDGASRPAPCAADANLPNPAQIEHAQFLVNTAVASAETAARLERQRRYERARRTPVTVRREPAVPGGA